MCPESFESFRESHIVKRAAALGAASFEVVDIRDFAEGSFRAVCDSPFGGGRGLLLRAEPIFKALQAALSGEKRDSGPGGSGQPASENVHGAVAGPGEENAADAGTRVVFLMPGGRTFSQGIAREYAALSHLVLVCGHYEGFDWRVLKHADERLSVGDYILTGGELPAMTVADAVLRLLPGCLKEGSAEEESFEQGLLEYPQYTQPAVWRGEPVPEVLLSGDHGKVAAWRGAEARRVTEAYRPDLLEGPRNGRSGPAGETAGGPAGETPEQTPEIHSDGRSAG